MIRISHRGDFKNTEKFLSNASSLKYESILRQYGETGVQLLAANTPRRSGKTASSWSYELHRDGDRTSIHWTNSNANKHVNIAVIIQTGHGTRTGGYVEGIDYINPALEPVFKAMADAIWKEVTHH